MKICHRGGGFIRRATMLCAIRLPRNANFLAFHTILNIYYQCKKNYRNLCLCWLWFLYGWLKQSFKYLWWSSFDARLLAWVKTQPSICEGNLVAHVNINRLSIYHVSLETNVRWTRTIMVLLVCYPSVWVKRTLMSSSGVIHHHKIPKSTPCVHLFHDG